MMCSTKNSRVGLILLIIAAISVIATGCGAPAVNSNTNTANTVSNVATPNSNMNSNTSAANTTMIETREPTEYQASVTMKLEAIGAQKATALPTLGATVARSGNDRRMEFAGPAGGRIVYLDKGGTHYLILPDRKQYAEITEEATGFQVRRMLMPEQIVEQAKTVKGLERMGEEQYNNRTAVRYKHAAVTNTQSTAGAVETDSVLLVDKETGLPLRFETVSQGSGNVQGYSGIRVITEMTDIKTEVGDDLFTVPTDLQKIEAAQVRAQVDMIFNAVAQVVMQMINRAGASGNPANSPQ